MLIEHSKKARYGICNMFPRMKSKQFLKKLFMDWSDYSKNGFQTYF